jgi:XTP/dITP diphosphohydrolase
VLVYLPRPDAVPQVFEASANGTILAEPRGTGGFGYDPFFLSDELEKSFAEATAEEKDTASHRGKALKNLIESLASSLSP